MLKKGLLLLLSLILTLSVVVGCTNTNTSDKVLVRIGFQTIPNSEAIAKANGWHETNIPGAEIQWLTFDSGRDVNTALASNGIDIGVLGSTLVATGLAKGLDYKVIWLADVIGQNEALVVKEDQGITSFDQIKGKKIAVTFGSTTQYTLLNALRLNHISPSNVTILDMQPPDMLAAWKRGDVDAGFVWQPTLEQMIADGGNILIDSGDLIDKGVVTADVIVVNSAFAKEHPDLVTAYIESQIRAVKLYLSNPAQAAESIAKEFSISKELALQMMRQEIWLTGEEQQSEKFLGTTEKPGDLVRILGDTALFLKEQNFIPTTPSKDTIIKAIDSSYIQSALDKGK